MRRFGGSFFFCIGEALARADLNNIAKIRDTWPEEWRQYLEMYNNHMKDED